MDAIHPPRKARTLFHQGLSVTHGDWEPVPAEAAHLADDAIRESALTHLAPAVGSGGLIMVRQDGEPIGITAATITRVSVEIVPTLDVAPGLSVGRLP